MLDLLHLARDMPCFPTDKYLDLRELARQREAAAVQISWPVLFIKAYALAAVDMPLLRQSYIHWPRPYLYEHAQTVASIAIHRRYRRSDRLFWGCLISPETTSLVDLQSQMNSYCTEPVEEIFARQLLLSRFPTWLRRLIWWGRLNLQPQHRARRMGTFGLSVLSGQGIYNRNYPHFLTMSLTFGPTEPDGRTLVTLIGDHRVADGIAVVRAFRRLERALHGPILDELATLQGESQAVA